jgi:hypothetical protein
MQDRRKAGSDGKTRNKMEAATLRPYGNEEILET